MKPVTLEPTSTPEEIRAAQRAYIESNRPAHELATFEAAAAKRRRRAEKRLRVQKP